MAENFLILFSLIPLKTCETERFYLVTKIELLAKRFLSQLCENVFVVGVHFLSSAIFKIGTLEA